MTENFNREEAKKIIEDISKSYYEANGKFIIKGNTEIVGASDSQLWGRSSVPYLIEAVEKALYSGMSAGEIEDAVLNASDNIPFQPEGGDVAKKGDLAQNNIARHLARSIPSKGKSDKELNLEYTKFKKDFIPEDWDDFDNKLKKDGVPTAQRQRILTHLKNNWSGDDGIKQTVLDVAKSKLIDGTSANSMELLAELAPYKGTGTPTLKNLSMFLVMPEMSDEEMLDSMMNFSSASSAKQAELKAARPPATTESMAATEAAEGGEMGPSQAGAGAYDPYSPREVHFQGRDGNFYKATYDPSIKEYISEPTLVSKDVAQAAIAREDAIYARDRADFEEQRGFDRRDAVTRRTQDLADIENLYTRQDENYQRDLEQGKLDYKRDLDQRDADYARDIAREDAKQRELNARYDIQRNQDMKRADLIMLGQWTRDDEVAYRNREWDIDDRRDDRLWEEAQQAEDRTFRTGQLAMQMGPQYFQSQLDAAEFEKDVLSNASDYIAAAFMQRGEASPFKAVTQADLINGFRAKARDMMQATEAGFRPDIGDPAEFAKGVVQAAGEAKGNAASTVGAALAGTYNPNPQPGGGAPAGPNTGTNTGTGSPKGPATGPAGSDKTTSDGVHMVNQIDHGDGTMTIIFSDGSQETIGTSNDPFVRNPNLQNELDDLNRRLNPDPLDPSTQPNQPTQTSTSMQGFNPNYELGAGFIGGNEWGTPTAKPAMAEGSEWNAGLPSGAIRPPTVRPPVGGVIHIPSSPTPGSEFEGQQFILPEEPTLQPPQSQVFGMPANTGMSDIEQINMVSEQFDAPQSVLPPTGGVMHIPSTQMQESFSYSDDVYGNPAQGAYDAQQQAAIAGIGNPAGAYMSGVNTPEQNPFYQYHPSMGFQGPEEESFSVTEDVYKSPAFRLPSTNINQSGFSPESNNAIPSMRPPQAPIFRGPTKPTYYDFEL
jgi:hypothetical protein